jgi:hypothetical protein
METKKCTRCGCVKNIDEFYDRDSNKDGKSKTCIKCLNYYSGQHYIDNKDAYIINIRKRKTFLRSFIFRVKRRSVCSICGEKRYWVLEFHHTGELKKEYGISKMASNGCSISKIKTELRKCIIVCANCHKDIHHGENSGQEECL